MRRRFARPCGWHRSTRWVSSDACCWLRTAPLGGIQGPSSARSVRVGSQCSASRTPRGASRPTPLAAIVERNDVRSNVEARTAPPSAPVNVTTACADQATSPNRSVPHGASHTIRASSSRRGSPSPGRRLDAAGAHRPFGSGAKPAKKQQKWPSMRKLAEASRARSSSARPSAMGPGRDASARVGASDVEAKGFDARRPSCVATAGRLPFHPAAFESHFLRLPEARKPEPTGSLARAMTFRRDEGPGAAGTSMASPLGGAPPDLGSRPMQRFTPLFLCWRNFTRFLRKRFLTNHSTILVVYRIHPTVSRETFLE